MPSWTCPFCKQKATLQDSNRSRARHGFSAGKDKTDAYVLLTRVIRCPNDECNRFTLDAVLWTVEDGQVAEFKLKDWINGWDLVPESLALALPAYIPAAIVEDYGEACLIETKSPKASATLSRRCLQGMIRDFWGVKVKSNKLVHEIDAIEDKVDPDVWQAIDAVRKLGNIGAHMEADISVIVDVDPDEARHLIELIELLIEEWYVARDNKQQRVRKVIAAAQAKDQQKQAAKPGLEK